MPDFEVEATFAVTAADLEAAAERVDTFLTSQYKSGALAGHGIDGYEMLDGCVTEVL